jgi:hypothetical protein
MSQRPVADRRTGEHLRRRKGRVTAIYQASNAAGAGAAAVPVLEACQLKLLGKEPVSTYAEHDALNCRARKSSPLIPL